MAADKGKKPKTAADDDSSYKYLDGQLVLSIGKLQEIQDELEKINEEANDKVLEVEQKYNEVRRPVYEKRCDIIKTIPDFWQTAFMSHPALFHLLTEDDQKVFEYLQSLDVTDSKDVKAGYSVTFSFSLNPYFENEKLIKRVAFDDDGNVKLTGTSIKWKEGMNVANGIVAHKKKGKKRPILKESFFTFFGEDEGFSDINEGQDEVAEMIKEDLWANPLKYFNNEGEEDDDDDEDDNDEIDDDEHGNGIMVEGYSDNGSEEDDEDEEDDITEEERSYFIVSSC